MKGIYVALIAAGTGMLGFLIGGGLGVFGGLVGGGSAGVMVGGVAGMCIPVETAVTERMITTAQVEQLGQQAGQKLLQTNPELAATILKLIPDNVPVKVTNAASGDANPICEAFLVQMKQGVQSSR